MTLSADAARRAGRAISAAVTDVGGQRLAAVSAPPGRDAAAPGGDDPGEAEQQRREAMRLLDADADGDVAIADAVADPNGGLTLVAASGEEQLVALPGVAGAAFAPTGGWLAVVDGMGRLWRVDRSTGTAASLADGPFAGAIGFDHDGALLMVALPSMEAPYTATLVTVDPDSGHVRAIHGGDSLGLVLAASELADGALAVIAHRLGEGVSVLRLADGVATRMAALGTDAVDASISEDGTAVAFARADGEVFLVRPGRGDSTFLGAGALPRVSADGSAVAILRDGQTTVVDAHGQELQRVAGPLAAWLRPGSSCGGCAS
jgi:hypothetical protein